MDWALLLLIWLGIAIWLGWDRMWRYINQRWPWL
jgi:hypothetical protein